MRVASGGRVFPAPGRAADAIADPEIWSFQSLPVGVTRQFQLLKNIVDKSLS